MTAPPSAWGVLGNASPIHDDLHHAVTHAADETERRTVCAKCGQRQGLFHKDCDGEWVEETRTVTPWRRTEHEHRWVRHQNVTSRGYRMPAYEACACGNARPADDAEAIAQTGATVFTSAIDDCARACVAVEDRHTAALWAEVERQATLLDAINDCHRDPARAILQADKIAGAAILRAERAEATIARVEALADKWRAAGFIGALDLDAALRGPEPTDESHFWQHLG